MSSANRKILRYKSAYVILEGTIATEGSADSTLVSSTPLVSAPCGRVYLAYARYAWMTAVGI